MGENFCKNWTYATISITQGVSWFLSQTMGSINACISLYPTEKSLRQEFFITIFWEFPVVSFQIYRIIRKCWQFFDQKKSKITNFRKKTPECYFLVRMTKIFILGVPKDWKEQVITHKIRFLWKNACLNFFSVGS